jgi:hypothetical protein
MYDWIIIVWIKYCGKINMMKTKTNSDACAVPPRAFI